MIITDPINLFPKQNQKDKVQADKPSPKQQRKEKRTDTDRDVATVEGILEISDRVLSDHSGGVEALCPGDQGSSVDRGLEDREGEGESELELSVSTD